MQLLTRMNLIWSGELGNPEEVAKTFGVVVFVFVLFILFNFWIPFVGILFLIYTLVYGTR
jgi:hypothetical protein